RRAPIAKPIATEANVLTISTVNAYHQGVIDCVGYSWSLSNPVSTPATAIAAVSAYLLRVAKEHNASSTAPLAANDVVATTIRIAAMGNGWRRRSRTSARHATATSGSPMRNQFRSPSSILGERSSALVSHTNAPMPAASSSRHVSGHIPSGVSGEL